MKYILSVVLFCFQAIAKASTVYFIADVSVIRADQCIYTRTVPVVSAVVVDMVNGLPINGYRVCKINLTGDPLNGVVTIALHDSIQGDTGIVVTFAFPLVPPQGGVAG